MAKDRKKQVNEAGRSAGPAEDGAGRSQRWEGRVGPLAGEASPQGVRADRYVADTLHLLTRSQIKARGARFFVNGKPLDPFGEAELRRLVAAEVAAAQS